MTPQKMLKNSIFEKASLPSYLESEAPAKLSKYGPIWPIFRKTQKKGAQGIYTHPRVGNHARKVGMLSIEWDNTRLRILAIEWEGYKTLLDGKCLCQCISDLEEGKISDSGLCSEIQLQLGMPAVSNEHSCQDTREEQLQQVSRDQHAIISVEHSDQDTGRGLSQIEAVSRDQLAKEGSQKVVKVLKMKMTTGGSVTDSNLDRMKVKKTSGTKTTTDSVTDECNLKTTTNLKTTLNLSTNLKTTTDIVCNLVEGVSVCNCGTVLRKLVWTKKYRIAGRNGEMLNKQRKVTTWRCMACKIVFEGSSRPGMNEKQLVRGEGVHSNINVGSGLETIDGRLKPRGSGGNIVKSEQSRLVPGGTKRRRGNNNNPMIGS